jgi:hypothetical protein
VHVVVVPPAEFDETQPTTLPAHVHWAGQSLSAEHAMVFCWQTLVPLGLQPHAASTSTVPPSATGRPGAESPPAAGGEDVDEPDEPPPVVPGVTVPVPDEPVDPLHQHVCRSMHVKPWPQSASTWHGSW